MYDISDQYELRYEAAYAGSQQPTDEEMNAMAERELMGVEPDFDAIEAERTAYQPTTFAQIIADEACAEWDAAEAARLSEPRTIRVTTTATMYRVRASGDVIERIIADFKAGTRFIDELVETEWDINDWRTERLMLATAHIVAIRERL